MKKKIKIAFVDFWGGFNYINSDFYKILCEKYEVQISKSPDYLFYGSYGHENLEYLDCVRIFYTGENITPDFNLCDYAMGFDWLKFEDRYFRFPNYYGRLESLKLCQQKHHSAFPMKTKFCSFVVSMNPQGYADPIRDEMFYMLSEYKRVDSGGRHLNNIGLPNGVPDKLEFQKDYKFALAFENSSHYGYTTEKIVDAFAAGCIPIYWGDPQITKVFNKKAFINVNDYSSLNEVVARIKEIDNNDSLYLKMLSEPAFVSSSYYYEEVKETLRAFLYNIIDQPYNSAKRRIRSYYVSEYESSLKYLKYIDFIQELKKKRKSLLYKLKTLLHIG